LVAYAALVLATLAIVVFPEATPVLVAVTLLAATPAWVMGWSAARGTALRPSLVWGAISLVLATFAQGVAIFEPIDGGRPATASLIYLASIAMLAALLSVLNARSPGGAVWASLMAMLVVVFMIPWFETPGRARQVGPINPPHLETPWTLFYGVLVLVGVTNYVPTRFGWSAGWLGVGLLLEYFGLTHLSWSGRTRSAVWSCVACSFALAGVTAGQSARADSRGRSRCERLWLWYRDGWGVVWALRNLDRFNREAELAGWPVRLTWFGLVDVDPGQCQAEPSPPEAAEATLRALIRRFADGWRLEQASGGNASPSCESASDGPS
jgi:hypothetical protein